MKSHNNYFLNEKINKNEALKLRGKIFKNSREEKIKKLEDMLSLFEVSKENIEYIKNNFYKNEVL